MTIFEKIVTFVTAVPQLAYPAGPDSPGPRVDEDFREQEQARRRG